MIFDSLKYLFEKDCEHEWGIVGYFYKESLTEYKNSFDNVSAYSKFRCKKCGTFSDHLLSQEDFLPQLHNGREWRKDDYISKLENMGFKQEVELMKS